MKRKIQLLATILVTLLLTTSCAKRIHDRTVSRPTTSIPTQGGVEVSQPASAETLQQVNAQRSGLQQVTGKVSLVLGAGDKNIGLNGNIKMYRNDVIQMAFSMFGMEVVRIELTNDYVLLLSRFNKQYMKLTYDDIPYFRSNGVTFYTFQSLFWNEVFALGANDAAPTAKAFTQAQRGDEMVLTTASQQVAIEFLLNSTNCLLKQTAIKPVNTKADMQWKYNGWTIVDGKSFPCDMSLNAVVQGRNIEADFKFSRLRTDEKWNDRRTNIDTNRYEEITVQKALFMIQSLIQ